MLPFRFIAIIISYIYFLLSCPLDLLFGKQWWLVDRNEVTGTARTRMLSAFRFANIEMFACLLWIIIYLFSIYTEFSSVTLKFCPPRGSPCFVRDHRCFCLWNFLSFLRTFDCRGIFKTVKVSEKNYLIRRSQYARILASKC